MPHAIALQQAFGSSPAAGRGSSCDSEFALCGLGEWSKIDR
jgi:hypothetical protein